MDVEHSTIDGVAVIAVKGRLSAESVEQLRNQFLDIFAVNKKIIFDLKEMDYLDSTGLGTLVFCLKSCKEVDGVLCLINLSDKAKVIFEITKAYKIFTILPSLDEAMTYCK